MISEQAAREIEKQVDQLDEAQIADLVQVYKHIRVKGDEDNQELVQRNSDYVSEYLFILDMIVDMVRDVQQAIGEKLDRQLLLDELAWSIRRRQEQMGFEKNLINPFFFTMLHSLIYFIENPQEIFVKKQKGKKQEKEKKIAKSIVLPDLRISLCSKDTGMDKQVIVLAIENHSSYPLQNVFIKLYDIDNIDLEILELAGKNAQNHPSGIYYPFILAPMGKSPQELSLELSISPLNDISGPIGCRVAQDFPALKEVLVDTFDLYLGEERADFEEITLEEFDDITDINGEQASIDDFF